jgi:GTP-binding protein
MLPVITLVGRPNVGKSTLFNCLTQTRNALVADIAGLTRDRIYGQGHYQGRDFIVVDTGGLETEKKGIVAKMVNQAEQAIREADVILFLVDGRAGVTADDRDIAQMLRKENKSIILVVNKVDDADPNIMQGEFFALGLGDPFLIAAAHKRGISDLIETTLKQLPPEKFTDETIEQKGIHIAIVGRPNVGKSTLINRMLGEERVVVYDQPGTTRDSISIPFERHGEEYVLIDTAGVRRKGQVRETIEKFSVIKSLQAIESANVVILVMDATENITEQDLHILGYILKAGKALIIAVNKWDGLTSEQREIIKNSLDRRLVFVDFAKIKFISALHGTGVGDLFALIKKAYQAATKKISTSEATRILEKAVVAHQPPLVSGRRIKLRYAHVGGHNPPVIIVHGKQTKSLPESYRKFLEGFYRKSLNLMGTPIKIEFKDSDNPYVREKK